MKCRYGTTFDGQDIYAYISESHADQIERNIEVSSDLGLVMYIFIFGSWALLLFTKLNQKQTLVNLIGSVVMLSLLFNRVIVHEFSTLSISFVLGIMFYTQWVLPWKEEEDPKEVHA